MRDYAKVTPEFWTGDFGRKLRGDAEAQLVALYLITSPHANMIGVFHCPLIYISHETGIPLEGASKALQRVSEGGFCTYDEGSDLIWVHEMALYQVGEALKAGDNRVKSIVSAFEKIDNPMIKRGFFERYAKAYHLPAGPWSEDPSKGLTKPLRSPSEASSSSSKQYQEQDYTAATARATDVPDGWPTEPMAELVRLAASPRLDPQKSPGLVTTAGRLEAWRAGGASWALDVVPIVTAAAQRQGQQISTWKFFDAAVAQALANRRAGLDLPAAQAPTQRRAGAPAPFSAMSYAAAQLAEDEDYR